MRLANSRRPFLRNLGAAWNILRGRPTIYGVWMEHPVKFRTQGILAVDSTILFDVRDFGAKGDGIADDAPAIQSALNATDSYSTTFGAPFTTSAQTTDWAIHFGSPRIRRIP